MQNNQNQVLFEMHRLELKIALEIKRICEKNGISYFLTAGTLLGAVRHGGFIPWDDDMDIGMLREDYERFLVACESDLGDEFFLQTWDTDPEFPFSYAKVRLKNTSVIERFSEENKSSHKGIFVDVFPFDNVPKSNLKRNIQDRKYYVCKRLLWIKKGMGTHMKRGTWGEKIKYYALYSVSLLLKFDSIKEYFRRIQLKYNSEVSGYIVTDGSYGYTREILKLEWANNLSPIKFENEEFMSFEDTHGYLSYFYGNYMQLPPEDKRGGHSIISVDFGPYATK